MPHHDQAWLRHQQMRWLRPDGDRWVRPDAARFLTPGSNLVEAFPALAFKYSPNQPRVPAGHPDGGQWTSGGGGFADFVDPIGRTPASAAPSMGDVAISDAAAESYDLFSIVPKQPERTGVRLAGELPEESDPTLGQPSDQPPKIPDEMPVTREGRMGFVRTAVRWIARMGRLSPAVDVFFGAINQIDEINRLTDMIRTGNDPPRSLPELQDRARLQSERGYQDHHVVGQFEENRRQFGDLAIDGNANMVRIPTLKHLDINGWYSKPNPEYGGLAPRDYLRGRSWDEQTQVGLKVLREFGVLR